MEEKKLIEAVRAHLHFCIKGGKAFLFNYMKEYVLLRSAESRRQEADDLIEANEQEQEGEKKRSELEYALKANLIKPMPAPEDTDDPQPPAKAQSLLCLLLEAKDREVVIGDMAERYGIKVELRGKLRANLWFYQQVVWSVWPLLQRTLVKLRRLGVTR
jgi:hypothetical protein